MAGNANKVVVDVELRAQLDQMKQGVKEIEGLFKNLNLSPTKNAGMAQIFTEMKKELSEIESMTEGGKIKGAAFSMLEKRLEKASSLYNKLGKEINTINGMSADQKQKLFPPEVANAINAASSKLKEYSKIEKQVLSDSGLTSKEKQYEKLSNQLDEAKEELEKYSQTMDKVNSKQITLVDKAVFNQLKSDFNNAQQAVIDYGKELENAKQKLNGIDKTIDPEGFKQAEEHVRSLENKLQMANEAADQFSAELNSVQVGNFSDLQNDLENSRQTVDKLTKQMESLDQEIKKIQAENPGKAFEILKQEIEKIQGLNLDWTKITNIQELEVALRDKIGAETNKLLQRLQEITTKSQNMGQPFSQMADEVKRARTALDETASSMRQIEQLAQRGLYFFGLANQVNLFKRAVKEAFNTVKELDKSMTETAVVTDFSVGDMWDQLPQYTKVANEYNATLKDAYDVMTLYYQQGLETNQVFEVGTETMKMARIAGLDYSVATDRMTNALRGFNMEVNNMNAEHVADVYSKLAAMSASNVKELSVAMTKVASLANSANMSFDNTAAFLAQIIETTRESAETAGTALKTVVARFSEVKKLYSEGDLIGDVEGEEINLNKVGEALRAAGIDLNEFMTGAKGLDEIFIELAKRWDSLDLLTQRYIATMAAGSRQQSRFLALMSDNERLTELLNGAYNAAGASTEQFSKTQESLQSKLNNLKNAWDAFLMGIANSSVIKGVVDFVTALITAINKLLDAVGKLGTVPKMIASIALAFGAMKIGEAIIISLSKKALALVGSLASVAKGAAVAGTTTQVAFSGIIGIFNKLALSITALTAKIKSFDIGLIFSKIKSGFSSLIESFSILGNSIWGIMSPQAVQETLITMNLFAAQCTGMIDGMGNLAKGVSGTSKVFTQLDGTVLGTLYSFQKGDKVLHGFKDSTGKLHDITWAFTDLQKLSTKATLSDLEAKQAAIAIQRIFGVEEKTAALAVHGFTHALTEEEAQIIKNTALKDLYNEKTKKLDFTNLAHAIKNNGGLIGGFVNNVKQGFAAITQGTDVAAKGVGGLIGKLGGLIAMHPLIAAGVVAITAAVVVAIAAFKKMYDNSPGQKLKKDIADQEAEIKMLNERLEEVNTTIEELTSNWQTLLDTRAELEELTEGTLEWYEALNKINNAALGIIQAFPGVEYEIDENGAYKINQASYSKIAEEQYKEQQALIYSISATEAEKQYNTTIQNLRDQKKLKTWQTEDNLKEAAKEQSIESAYDKEKHETYYKVGDQTFRNKTNQKGEIISSGYQQALAYVGTHDAYNKNTKEYRDWKEYSDSEELARKTLESQLTANYTALAKNQLSTSEQQLAESIGKYYADQQIEEVKTNGSISSNAKKAIEEYSDGKGGNYGVIKKKEYQRLMDYEDSKLSKSKTGKNDTKEMIEAAKRAGIDATIDGSTVTLNGKAYEVSKKANDKKGTISYDQMNKKLLAAMTAQYQKGEIDETSKAVSAGYKELGEVTATNITEKFKNIKAASEKAAKESGKTDEKEIEELTKQTSDILTANLNAQAENYAKALNNVIQGGVEWDKEKHQFIKGDGQQVTNITKEQMAVIDAYNEATNEFMRNLISSIDEIDREGSKKVQLKSLEKAYKLFGSISSSSIQGAAQIKKAISSIVNSAEGELDKIDQQVRDIGLAALNSGKYNIEAQFDELVNGLFQTEDWEKALDKAKENGKITANSIASLGGEFGDLSTFMNTTEVSSGALAVVLQNVTDGTLAYTDANKTLLVSLSKLTEVDSAIADTMYRLDDARIGASQAEGVSEQGNKFYNATKTIAERGAWGDTQLDDYMNALLGEETWSSYIDNPDYNREEAYKAAIKDAGYEGSGTSIFYNQLVNKQSSADGLYTVGTTGIDFDFSQIEKGTTVAQALQDKLKISAEQAKELESYCALLSPDFKAAANEVNKVAANVSLLKSSVTDIKEENGKKTGTAIISNNTLRTHAKEQGYDKDNNDIIDSKELDEYKKKLEDLSKIKLKFIDPKELNTASQAATDWAKAIKDAGTELFPDDEFQSVASQIRYYLEQGVSSADIGTLIGDQLGNIDTSTLLSKIAEAFGEDSALYQNVQASVEQGVGASEAFILGYEKTMAEQNQTELSNSVAGVLNSIDGWVSVVPMGIDVLAEVFNLPQLTNPFKFHITGSGFTGAGTTGAGAGTGASGITPQTFAEDLGNNEGGGHVNDDSYANGTPKSGSGGGGGGGGSDKDDDDKDDNLERLKNALKEGGAYFAPFQLMIIKKQMDLLRKQHKLQLEGLDAEEAKLKAYKDQEEALKKLGEKWADGDLTLKDIKDTIDAIDPLGTNGNGIKGFIDSFKGSPEEIKEMKKNFFNPSDEYYEYAEEYDKFGDERDEAIGSMIDKGVEWANQGIEAAGQLAQSVLQMIEKVMQSMIDGFKSFLGWLTIRIDDEHDINELNDALKNRKDLLDWEFDKLAEKDFDYTKGVHSKSQENLFENINDAAQNVLIRLQNQRRLYENSFRQLEDLGTNINSDIEASLEEMYEALYGVDGVFTKINDKVQYLEQRFEKATNWNLTRLREIDPIGKLNEIFGTNIPDIVADALDPLNLFEGSLLDKFFKKSLQQIAGLEISEYRLGNVGESLLQKIANFFYELAPKFDADYQIVNKSELVDALNQKMQTIITNDTITSQFVQNYLDYLTEIESQMESEVDNIRNAESEILNLYDEMTEILEKGKEEYTDLEQQIYDAIVSEKESLKEELEELNSNITDADGDLIDILKTNLEQIRQQRENDQTERDLRDKEARLAYLKQDTSGANKEEILKLEKELEEGQQSYTDKLIDQKIDELEKQNQEAADQRQIQIDLLQEEINNTKLIWEKVKQMMDAISGNGSWDDLLKGEIKQEAYYNIIEQLKKSKDFEEKSEFEQGESINEWGVLIRKASLYGTMLKDEYQDMYNDLKVMRDILDVDTKLPIDHAADSGWHDYVAFSNLETAVKKNTDAVKNAVSVINRIVDAKTLDFQETGSVFKKATEAGAKIQAMSGLEDAVKNFANDVASGLPGILTQVTTGFGNLAKGGAKAAGAAIDTMAGAMTLDLAIGDLGEGIGMVMEGVSNLFAAGCDAASLMCDIIGDTSPGFTDMGVAAGTLIANWLDNAFEEVDDHLRENVDKIMDEMFGEEVNGIRLGGYYEQMGTQIEEQKDALKNFYSTGVHSETENDAFADNLFTSIEQHYRDVYDQIQKLEPNDIEGFNKQYSRFLALQKILEKIGHTETVETYMSDSIQNLEKWAGETGSMFAELSERERQIVVDAINNAIYPVIAEETYAQNRPKTELWESNLKFKTSDIQYYNDIYKEFVDNVNYSVEAIDEAITAINSIFYDPYENEYTSPSAQLLVRKLEQLEGKRAEQEITIEKSIWENFIDNVGDIWGEIGNRILEVVHAGQDILSNIFDFLSRTFNPGSDFAEAMKNLLGGHAMGGAINKAQRALVGELGPELVQHADGTATIVGRYGPEMANLKAGDQIYTAEQTKRILKSGGSMDFNRFAEGTVGTLMARAPLALAINSIDFGSSTRTVGEQNTNENHFNLNLNLEGLTVDSPDRVEEVADKVWNKLNDTVSNAIWPYNKL